MKPIVVSYSERDKLFREYITEFKRRFNTEPSALELRVFIVNNNTVERLLKSIEELKSFEGAQIP
tara:strand:+ start:1603 stop:1797 length:195 start_codon:yes stop_codon:yes gene_type:complete